MDFPEAFDLGTLYWFGSWHRPWLDTLMRSVTRLGDPYVLTAVALLGVLGFLLYRRPASGLLAAEGVLTWLLNEGTKLLVARPRPDVVWHLVPLPHTSSFPSGHALGAAAIYVGLALVVSRYLRRRAWRVLLIAVALVLTLLIGLSRPYLGVHYPTDVIAGWCAGLALALLVYTASERWPGAR
jgi:undecaprenyl-diphosphatase